MGYTVQSKGWLHPEDPDEWLSCNMHELNTLDEAVEFIVKMVRSDGPDTYPYRIRETFPVTISKEAQSTP